jgi:ribosomal-protein-alanine N-acetyltransferase
MSHHNGLRKMTVADAAAVHIIDKTVTIGPWSEKLYCDCIEVGYECWVMVEDKTIIGFGVMSCAVNEAHILNLAIAPEFQRNGLGQKMLQHLLDTAKMHGAEEVFLEVRPSNGPARELYKKMNFVEIGLRKDYYPPDETGVGREDGLSLVLPLY